MSDKLEYIDIPAARKEILKSISEYRREATLASVVYDFLSGMKDKRIDRRAIDKLKTLLSTSYPDLKVHMIIHHLKKPVTPGYPAYFELDVYRYDMTEEKRSFRAKVENGVLDLEDMMAPHRLWGPHADFLEESLQWFTPVATNFNKHLSQLAEYAQRSKLGIHSVGPLSGFLAFYKLPEPRPQ